jgi:hypothetical protein
MQARLLAKRASTEPIHKAHRQQVFIPRNWHLNPYGHQLVATTLQPFIAEQALPRRCLPQQTKVSLTHQPEQTSATATSMNQSPQENREVFLSTPIPRGSILSCPGAAYVQE